MSDGWIYTIILVAVVAIMVIGPAVSKNWYDVF